MNPNNRDNIANDAATVSANSSGHCGEPHSAAHLHQKQQQMQHLAQAQAAKQIGSGLLASDQNQNPHQMHHLHGKTASRASSSSGGAVGVGGTSAIGGSTAAALPPKQEPRLTHDQPTPLCAGRQSWEVIRCFLAVFINLKDEKHTLQKFFLHPSFLENNIVNMPVNQNKIEEFQARKTLQNALTGMFVDQQAHLNPQVVLRQMKVLVP